MEFVVRLEGFPLGHVQPFTVEARDDELFIDVMDRILQRGNEILPGDPIGGLDSIVIRSLDATEISLDECINTVGAISNKFGNEIVLSPVSTISFAIMVKDFPDLMGLPRINVEVDAGMKAKQLVVELLSKVNEHISFMQTKIPLEQMAIMGTSNRVLTTGDMNAIEIKATLGDTLFIVPREKHGGPNWKTNREATETMSKTNITTASMGGLFNQEKTEKLVKSEIDRSVPSPPSDIPGNLPAPGRPVRHYSIMSNETSDIPGNLPAPGSPTPGESPPPGGPPGGPPTPGESPPPGGPPGGPPPVKDITRPGMPETEKVPDGAPSAPRDQRDRPTGRAGEKRRLLEASSSSRSEMAEIEDDVGEFQESIDMAEKKGDSELTGKPSYKGKGEGTPRVGTQEKTPMDALEKELGPAEGGSIIPATITPGSPEDVMDRDEEKGETPFPAGKSMITTVVEPKQYNKNLGIDYFDVMNPENYYPLVIDISDLTIETKDTEINILTGERKIQKKEQLEAKLKDPRVKVRPIFPGCSITPPELMTDFDERKDTLTFYITPLVKERVNGYIEFIGDGRVFTTVQTPCEVKDPRYARVVAFYGILAAIVPKLGEWFGLNLGSSISMGVLSDWLASISLANFIAMVGIGAACAIGVVYYIRRQPSSVSKKYHLKDFKLKSLGLMD